MNLLAINNGGEYTSKMMIVKIILYVLGVVVFIPAIYTNYLFFQSFFDISTDNTFGIFGLYSICILIEGCKFVALYTFVSIYFASLNDESKYFDLITFTLYILLVSASIFFQYEGLQHKSFFELEKVKNQIDSLPQITIDTIQKNGVSVKDRTKHLTATAGVLTAITKINEQKTATIEKKATRAEKMKNRLIDKRFFFILFCEFLAVFCVVSIAYLEYKREIEQAETDSEGNEDIKKLQSCYRSAIRRGNKALSDKHKAELEKLGAKIPNSKL